MKLYAGVRVFACDNTAVSGDEIILRKKHTKNFDIRAELPEAFDRYREGTLILARGIEELKATPCAIDAKEMIYDLFRRKIVPVRLFHPVVESWHMQLTDDRLVSNAWVLHNCFTEHIKKLTPNAPCEPVCGWGSFSSSAEGGSPWLTNSGCRISSTRSLRSSSSSMARRSLEPVRLNEWRTVSEQIWAWAKERVSSTVEEYTDGFLDPPPEVGTPGQESPDESALHEAKTPQQNISQSRVSSYCAAASGKRQRMEAFQSAGDRWDQLYDLAGHHYEVGKEYTIEYEAKQSGSFIDYRIKEPK